MKNLKTLTILFRATNAMEIFIKQSVQPFGLNPSEFGTLEVLYHKGDLSVQAICDKVLIANSSMSYVIEHLVRRNLIKKIKHPDDRRVHLVSLTSSGKELMDQLYPVHAYKMRSVLDVLSLNEEELLQSLLKKLGKQEYLNFDALL